MLKPEYLSGTDFMICTYFRLLYSTSVSLVSVFERMMVTGIFLLKIESLLSSNLSWFFCSITLRTAENNVSIYSLQDRYTPVGSFQIRVKERWCETSR